eukprot:6468232-Amphidinium_carterae.1
MFLVLGWTSHDGHVLGTTRANVAQQCLVAVCYLSDFRRVRSGYRESASVKHIRFGPNRAFSTSLRSLPNVKFELALASLSASNQRCLTLLRVT